MYVCTNKVEKRNYSFLFPHLLIVLCETAISYLNKSEKDAVAHPAYRLAYARLAYTYAYAYAYAMAAKDEWNLLRMIYKDPGGYLQVPNK
jgi:hypothetical protein